MLPEKEMREMIDALLNGGHRIYFQVGKIGRNNRFVLAMEDEDKRPLSVGEKQIDPGSETIFWLWLLDEVVRTADRNVALMYSNSRKRGYCLWMVLPKEPSWPLYAIAPVYEARLKEQWAIGSKKLKRGHVNFGFLPFEGHS